MIRNETHPVAAMAIREFGSPTPDGWSLNHFSEVLSHPDFETGMSWVANATGTDVVIFVGTKEQAAKVSAAAQEALRG